MTLPTGAYLGLGLAAAISTALAATRLHRRRRRTYDQWPGPADPEPAPPSAVATARKAYLDTYASRGEPIPSDAGLVATGATSTAPTQITVGTHDSQELTLPLPGLSLGLTGPGALRTARAIATELIATAHRERVELLMPEPDAAALFAESGIDTAKLSDEIPGLITTPSPGAAIAHLEAELIHRARLLESTDEPDVPAMRAADPGEPLPAVVVIAAVPQHVHALQAALQLGHRYSIGGLLLGDWPAGSTVHIDRDGTVTRAHGAQAASWIGARLFHLSAAEATDILHVVRTASGAPETLATVQSPVVEHAGNTVDNTPPRPVPPGNGASLTAPMPQADASDGDQQHPVRLQLLGPFRLEAAATPITTGLRRIARDLLVYLALNPNGVTREQGIDALFPDRDLESGTTMFHTAVSNARKVLRTASGRREPMFIIHAGGRYRLDPHLIEVDLWQLLNALNRAQHAETAADRIQALRPLPDLYTGDLADDLTYEWAESHRERLRRHATDALAHLARLTQDDHPDQALAALEHAIDHDPFAEPLHRAVMRLQARLGRHDAVRRTYQLLENRLAELDVDPSEETHQLLLSVLRPSAAGKSSVGSGNELANPRDHEH